MGSGSVASASQFWSVGGGKLLLSLEGTNLEELGLEVFQTGQSSSVANGVIEYSIEGGPVLEFFFEGNALVGLPKGALRTRGGLVFATSERSFAVEDIVLEAMEVDGLTRLAVVEGDWRNRRPLLVLGAVKLGFSAADQSLRWESGDVTIASALADHLDRPDLVDAMIGGMSAQAPIEWAGGDEAAEIFQSPMLLETGRTEVETGGTGGGNSGTNCWNPGEPLIGPDVIVGDLIDISNYAAEGAYDAFAVGTTSCNIGSSNLLWVDNTPNVPVIGQNMFRLKNGRFEQIGQGWLKYAFTALTQNACGCFPQEGGGATSCQQGGSVLGVGCSDPYCCGLNGNQGNLGPKYQINAYTGSHPSFPANPPFSGSVARRVKVLISDLDTAQNPGAMWFVEGHYVTPDDATAGNQFNNASYRQIKPYSGTGIPNQNPDTFFIGSTQREKPGIRAWKANDPSVSESDIRIPGEGLLILASKATDLGGGLYHYEYALQNLNSDRSVGSFSIPLDPAITVQNIGFHDVEYHSGELQDNTDWTATVTSTAITWETTPYSVNQNANALRWGTLYNFRFDADAPPSRVGATIGLFKPGTPASVEGSTDGPTICNPALCDDTNPCTDDGGCGPAACTHTYNANACDDADGCTANDTCSAGACIGTAIVVLHGDIYPAGGDDQVDVDDMVRMVEAFGNPPVHPEGDIYPCPPNLDGVVDVDDIGAIVAAFGYMPLCADPCPPP
jgi:hypothetical protein